MSFICWKIVDDVNSLEAAAVTKDKKMPEE
jgi:hypothetical protein